MNAAQLNRQLRVIVRNSYYQIHENVFREVYIKLRHFRFAYLCIISINIYINKDLNMYVSKTSRILSGKVGS